MSEAADTFHDDVIRVLAPAPVKRGRPTLDRAPVAATPNERKQRQRSRESAIQRENIAVLDFETDPFDNGNPHLEIQPFAGCLYSDNFDPIVIWDTDRDSFIDKVVAAIMALPEKYIIYAHNGGRFDFLFLIKKIRGRVMFKGRGIMSARIGVHELRDSFHIIPERLANFQKDTFDYKKLTKANRHKHRDEIIRYMVNDCRYLLDIVKSFVEGYGLKISIGQAAMYELKKEYKVKRIGEQMDATLRNYFFGGRVECLAGLGRFRGERGEGYTLYDVNSMYPHVMASYQHPIGNAFTFRRGEPGPHTIFVDIDGENFGALIGKGSNGETTGSIQHGTFRTTIWEYHTALKHNLLGQYDIRGCVDCEERSNFSRFVMPLYDKRRLTKRKLEKLAATGDEKSQEYNDTKKDDIFLKLILNNAYGKFAQNPRRFKETFVSDPGQSPPADDLFKDNPDAVLRSTSGWGDLPVFRSWEYWIWERPAPEHRFNNVATAASITGAARSILLDAICKARDPIYCDTDSVIAADLSNLPLHNDVLGAWKVERKLVEVIIAGKKLYAYKYLDKAGENVTKIRSKGAAGLTWADIESILGGNSVATISKAPTLVKTGTQYYMNRSIRATAPKELSLIRQSILERAIA